MNVTWSKYLRPYGVSFAFCSDSAFGLRFLELEFSRIGGRVDCARDTILAGFYFSFPFFGAQETRAALRRLFFSTCIFRPPGKVLAIASSSVLDCRVT